MFYGSIHYEFFVKNYFLLVTTLKKATLIQTQLMEPHGCPKDYVVPGQAVIDVLRITSAAYLIAPAALGTRR